MRMKDKYFIQELSHFHAEVFIIVISYFSLQLPFVCAIYIVYIYVFGFYIAFPKLRWIPMFHDDWNG